VLIGIGRKKRAHSKGRGKEERKNEHLIGAMGKTGTLHNSRFCFVPYSDGLGTQIEGSKSGRGEKEKNEREL